MFSKHIYIYIYIYICIVFLHGGAEPRQALPPGIVLWMSSELCKPKGRRWLYVYIYIYIYVSLSLSLCIYIYIYIYI